MAEVTQADRLLVSLIANRTRAGDAEIAAHYAARHRTEAVKPLAEALDLPVAPRRPLDADRPEGYMESDRDFMLNNLEACVAFLEARAALRSVQS